MLVRELLVMQERALERARNGWQRMQGKCRVRAEGGRRRSVAPAPVRLLPILMLMSACGGSGNGSGSAAEPASAASAGGAQDAPAEAATAASLVDQEVLTAGEYLNLEPYASASVEDGERVGQMCRACHSFDAGGSHMIGPNLAGFLGQKAGFASDFDYSTALAEADFVWTPEALDLWLEQPFKFLPGNRMTFAGVPDPGQRAALIAWLLSLEADDG